MISNGFKIMQVLTCAETATFAMGFRQWYGLSIVYQSRMSVEEDWARQFLLHYFLSLAIEVLILIVLWMDFYGASWTEII